MQTFKERNYKKEYENYHSKPEQKKRRAGRNHARRQLKDTKGIMMTHKALGHMPDGLMRTRNQIYDNLMRQSSSKYSNHKDVISSF